MHGRIHQVQIKNFRSIGKAVVDLGDFTALVGRNGAGKSNFVDALSFVADCLSNSIELAFKNRGGINAVRRHSGGHPTHIGIRLLLEVEGASADYSFEIAAKSAGRFVVARERCILQPLLKEEIRFEVEEGRFRKEIPGIRSQVAPDRLALFAASATEEFRPIFDFLSSMQFYSIEPGRLRELQDPDEGALLKPDGSNAAAVLKTLQDLHKDRYERVCRLLARVVEGVSKVDYKSIGQKETLIFRQDVGQADAWKFEALNMSDGTLRVLGLLLAAYQAADLSLVAIEEPEATIHPAAAELLTQVLLEASKDRQILITTHSPDILDAKQIDDTHLRFVTNRQGSTEVARISEMSREAIRNRLYTPGEMMRAGELTPDIEAAESAARQLKLFGRPVALEEVG